MKYFIYVMLILFLSNFAYSEIFFYHSDHLGSPRVLTDGLNILWSSDYLPFGKEINSFEIEKNDLIFNQKEKDSTDLYYYGSRVYDDNIGRFITPDSIENLPNPYTYVSNNPLNRIDPTGNKEKKTLWVKGLDTSPYHEAKPILLDFDNSIDYDKLVLKSDSTFQITQIELQVLKEGGYSYDEYIENPNLPKNFQNGVLVKLPVNFQLEVMEGFWMIPSIVLSKNIPSHDLIIFDFHGPDTENVAPEEMTLRSWGYQFNRKESTDIFMEIPETIFKSNSCALFLTCYGNEIFDTEMISKERKITVIAGERRTAVFPFENYGRNMFVNQWKIIKK